MNTVHGTADHMYRNGFYQPGPADPEYVAGGHRMPHGSLPRFVPADPQHLPSTVSFVVRLPDRSGAFGGRTARWRRTVRTQCGCGRVWGRSRTVDQVVRLRQDVFRPVGHRTGGDDVAVRGLHTSHTYALTRRSWQEAA